MTDDSSETLLDRIDDSRRDFMKKGALATGALALGASGTAAAQEDDDGVFGDGWEALVFIDNFHPNARFTFVSGVVDWVPNYGDVRDTFFTDYNTYHIRWLNTDEVVPLFVAEDAPIGEYDEDLGFIPDEDDDADQPQLYEMEREWSPFGDNERLIEVDASPVDEDEEDQILENEDWWQPTDDDGGGTNGAPTDDNTTNGT
ncbi:MULTISPECIES: twin-arginine translocation signal domain-containing protein [Haloarcula]|uniref:twin-arginine translocation signal domain-containing protein n=1 Tax=Haloarcula TaxID=2237 RepID=UPI0023E8B383|nr:twin-arginine translocation signal domain-containing protein [Halomicroarcula sp. SHR3]